MYNQRDRAKVANTTPITDHIRGTVKREFRLHFADILHIEHREYDRLTTFTGGFAAGAMVIIVLILYGFSQLSLD